MNNENGCSSSSVVEIMENIIVFVIDVGLGSEFICEELEVFLFVIVMGNIGDYVYIWIFVDGNIVSGGNILNLIVNVGGFY